MPQIGTHLSGTAVHTALLVERSRTVRSPLNGDGNCPTQSEYSDGRTAGDHCFRSILGNVHHSIAYAHDAPRDGGGSSRVR